MSEVKVNKISPRSGTDVQLGDSGDTITVPTGATFDASNATTTLPANIVTTDGSQTLTNKTIDASQLTGTITPSDNTVTLAKLTATGTKDATTFLRGDNTFATPTDNGKVLQVVQATDETARSTTSGTYVTASNTLLVNITPSSTSSKILIMVNTSAYHNATSSTMNGAIFKNGSILKTITYGFKRDDDSAVISGVYLDSPATTSSIAYQLYFSMSTGTAFINASNTLGTITAMEIAG